MLHASLCTHLGFLIALLFWPDLSSMFVCLFPCVLRSAINHAIQYDIIHYRFGFVQMPCFEFCVFVCNPVMLGFFPT